MIDYKLAKQLKDAGLPQSFGLGRWYYSNWNGEEVYKAIIDKPNLEFMEPRNDIAIPTLSELIEACGEWFLCLIRMPDNTWRTNINRPTANIVKTIINGSDYIVGDTPEEAVAKLLKDLLNKEADKRDKHFASLYNE